MTPPDDQQSPFTVRTSRPLEEISPNIDQATNAILYDGKLSRKEIVHFVIKSQNTGEINGDTISFCTYHRQSGIWKNEPSKSFILEGNTQINLAVNFIAAACGGNITASDGKYLVVRAPQTINGKDAQELLNSLSQSGRVHVLIELLNHASRTPQLFEHLLQRAADQPELLVEAAATLNLARYRRSLEILTNLIESSNQERDFQALLEEHPWMFGSEYSERLDRRNLVRDAQQDFVLRRTTDGYIEIVEIKTPLGDRDLFRFDPSRKSYLAEPELSAAVGQVQKYIEELEADRLAIQFRDGEDTCKVRAKIIIGRDGSKDQQQALRRFNGHLHRIEVLTFDQLARIAGRVVAYLEYLIPSQDNGSRTTDL